MVKTRCRLLFPIFLLVTSLLLTGLLSDKGFAAGNNPPNMVFILTDDHRWDALSIMGHPFLETPNLDRLANEGILFENAFVTTSLCSPSRASFLTGQYAHTHGVVTNHTPWDNRNVTFLERLNAAGYETAFIGKWHMPGDGLPQLRGVDRFVSFTREGGQGVYYDCPLIIDGVETARPGRYITEDLTDLALDFMARKREKPFCLYLSHKAVHFGFRPPPHLKGRYRGVDLRLPLESDPWIPYTNGHPFVGAIFPLDFLYRNYCETVVSVDEQVGRILAALDAMGIAENTIVIYTGDNGHFWGEHGLYDKRLAYEESIRIPFIVRYPGLIPDPGRRASQMVLNIDLAPTLLELAGLVPPVNMQGQSLVPILEDATTPGRTAWLYEHFPVFPIPIPGITAIRTERYKYVEYQTGLRPRELFDLKEDPQEKNNLVATPEGAPQVELLKRELERLRQETGYRFHTRG
jgi:arylsulfatase A-like enzyme